MTSQPPTWTAFQPDAPPALSPDRGHVVALVSLSGADDSARAAELAIELARAWSRAGSRVVLADLGLSAPVVHTKLGLDTGAGVTDSVAFGASVGRVARSVEDAPFFFIGAGTAVADPGSLLEHPRWEALCQGFQEAGATLVAFVPGGAETREHVLRHATDVVLLGSPDDDPSALDEAVGSRVRAFLGQPARGEAEEEQDEVVSVEALAPDTVPQGPGALPDEDEEPVDQAPAPVGGDAETDDLAFDAPDGESGPEGEPGGALDDVALEPEEPEAGTDTDDFALEAEEPEAETDEFALEPEEPEADADTDDFALEPEEPEAETDDFALEPEDADADDPAVPEASSEAEHPPVPLADEILAEAGDAPEPAAGTGEGVTPSPPGERAAAGRSGGRRTLLLFLLLLVTLMGAAAAWWLGYVEIPGVTRPGATTSSQPQESVAPLAAAEPTVETAPSAAWAVAVEAHQDRQTAWDRRESLAAAVPEQSWITVPVDVDGTVFHRVLVGTVAEASGGEALLERMAGELGTTADGWLLRATPLAYRLGETEEVDAARRRVEVLRDLDIPAYVLAVSYSDGSERFRVYAGAFADTAEARALGDRLTEQGITERDLIERTGRLPE